MDRDELPVTERTRLRRLPQRGSTDRALLEAILDEGLVVHVGFAPPAAQGEGGSPFVIPTTYVRVEGALYIHGAPASRMLKVGASGVDICATVTLLDGLVLARSAFHHSMNYRSAIVFGRARDVTDLDEKRRVLAAMVDRLVPGRAAEARAPTIEELKATRVLALPLDEASVKVRTGPPRDDEADMTWPAWAGVIPLALVRGQPIPDPPSASASASANPRPVEATHASFTLSDDRTRIDFARVTEWLKDAYWCPGIPRELVERAARFSTLVVGAYAGAEQVGYLRAVSDGTRFAYLMDVFVAEPHRGRGLGRALVRFALTHPDHRDVLRWLLGTKDAHGVYAPEGFRPLSDPTRFMERMGVWPHGDHR
jgi:nitroimidazol reductase NimA-like FMN-containing flavoprotein (pyridoxamine 5'-phosphate oxidase superfamily)/GNAT superfamily N-acetyltransferase